MILTIASVNNLSDILSEKYPGDFSIPDVVLTQGSSSNSQKKSAFIMKTFSNFYYALDTLLDVIIEIISFFR